MSKNPVPDPLPLNIGRDQVLKRLWELANISLEATRGSMAGQVKAIAMIVAIEGLIPDRRTQAQSAAPPVPPSIYVAEWRRNQQQQDKAAEPAEASAPQTPAPEPPPPAGQRNTVPGPESLRPPGTVESSSGGGQLYL